MQRSFALCAPSGGPRLRLDPARARHQRRSLGTALGRAAALSVEQILERYAALAAVVRPTAIPRTAPELQDDVVIGTAVAAKADLLVTGDRPLLLSVPEYQGVRLVGVREALGIAGGAGETTLSQGHE